MDPKLYKLAEYFTKKISQSLYGKDYIKQKPDGTLIVDEVRLDRDELNAMKNWQDLVNLGLSKSRVGQIALEYGGPPRDLDVWLEQNSTPYIDEEEETLEIVDFEDEDMDVPF